MLLTARAPAGQLKSVSATRCRAAFAPRLANQTRRVAAMASAGVAPLEKTVLVPIGNGTEEMEAVIIIDVLRRAGAKARSPTIHGLRVAYQN